MKIGLAAGCALFCVLAACVSGVSSAPPEATAVRSVTYGDVKRLMVDGQSTQTEAIRALGSPHNMTLSKTGGEVWIYEYHHSSSTTSGAASMGYGTVLFAGGAGASSSSTTQTRSEFLTIILEFDKQGVLLSHEARTGSY